MPTDSTSSTPKGIPNICNKGQKQNRYPFQKITLYRERAARVDTF